jgi:RNA polymerase sigma factor (sigma-70 family)
MSTNELSGYKPAAARPTELQLSAEFLLAFRQGERTALESVYRTYVDDVLNLFRRGFVSGEAQVRGISDRQALLDATQEVFVKAFGRAGRLGYDGVRPYRPYLLQIARNVRIDTLRRSGREVLVAMPFAADLDAVNLEEALAEGRSIETPIHREDSNARELRGLVRRYVSGLSAELQQFVELRFCDELAQAEVAERMSVTRRRVRTWETFVLSGLRKMLEEADASGRDSK